MVAFIDLKKANDTVEVEKLLDCLEHLEQRSQLGDFLTELYRGVECEVRVSDVMSNPFEVTTGLRQGCVVSSLLFSLYIKGISRKAERSQGRCKVKRRASSSITV